MKIGKFSGNKKRKRLILFIELELAAVLIVVLALLHTSLNAGNVEKYADNKDKPVVTAEDGYLSYDMVSVKVSGKGANYIVGYDWAEDDTDYPTVPSSASAYYNDSSGQVAYEVFLYRDKVTPKKSDGRKYSLDTWREEWEQSEGENAAQEAYKTEHTKGFLIKDKFDSEDSGENKTYCSYTYYFAVETDSDIEQYVLELSFYDPDAIKGAEKTFKSCADSISVRKAA